MSDTQFNHVSVIKEATVHFGGKCISHTVLFEDGKKKMLGVILPTGEEPLKFETHTSERMEIISGECMVRLAGEDEFKHYRASQSFFVKGNSSFAITTPGVLNYVCHLEG